MVIELSTECRSYTNNPSPADGLVLISNELWQLRSERAFHPRASDSESVDRDIICRCASLETQLEAWKLRCSALAPSSISIESSRADVLGDYYDVYVDTWTAGVYNQYRRLAILASELAVTRLLNLQRRGVITRQETLKVQSLRLDLIEHVYAICASVPHLLDSGRIEAAKGLLWPLYLAAQLNPNTVPLNSAIREWMIKRLNLIGHERGIRQSLFLVEVLLKREEVTDLLIDNEAGTADYVA